MTRASRYLVSEKIGPLILGVEGDAGKRAVMDGRSSTKICDVANLLLSQQPIFLALAFWPVRRSTDDPGSVAAFFGSPTPRLLAR